MPHPRTRRASSVADLPGVREAIAAAVERGADGPALLGVLDEAAATLRDDRLRLRLAVVYPAAVFVLALVGLVWSSLANGPLIRGVEASFLEPPPGAPPSPWPNLGPVELAIAGASGLAVIALVAWLVRGSHRDTGHLATAVRCDLLAELTACDTSTATRHRLAADLLAALGLAERSSATALVASAESPTDDDARAAQLWAVAMFERSLDERRRRRTRGLVPVVGCLIAGIAVLLYGVSLFRPMAGFLDFLAAPRGMIDGGRGP
ncbi:MAG: hypothetical protein KJS77_08585 [Planctomycetes bacterium]|nr:hypothetical protein [Planctomycetota bacterium]